MTNDFTGLKKAELNVATKKIPPFATVVDVIEGKGIKVRLDGKAEAKDIYYNSLEIVNVGDRVHIIEIADSILIYGKLKY